MRKIYKKTPMYSTFRHVNHFLERQHSQNGYSNLVKQKAALYCKEKRTWRNSVTYFVRQLNKGQGTVPTLSSVLRNAGYFAIIIRIYLTSKHVKEAFMI